MASPARPASSLAVLFLFVGSLTLALAGEVVGDAQVKDGDSIVISGQSTTEVRLHGVDAPELGQTCGSGSTSWDCGQQAKKKLTALVKWKIVKCVGSSQDQYGRMVAKCSVGGEDLGLWMVSRGWARAWAAFSTDYVGAEAAARAGGKGIWAGGLESPWEYRKRQKYSACDASKGSNDCTIKGNINKQGVKIYHMPGSKWYSRTRIDTDEGERWFCSRAEAEAAGWRAAR